MPEPDGLVVAGGMANVAASLAHVHGFTQLPMPQSEQLTELLTGEAIGPVIDDAQPVYFALAIVGSGLRMKPPHFALSAAVKDVEQVKASLAERFKLVPGENGVTLIQGLGRGAHGAPDTDAEDDDDKPGASGGGDDADGGRTCELAPSAGEAPVRLVCGISEAALQALGPYLTRTAPRRAPPTDLHAEVRMAPMQPSIAEGKKLVSMLAGGMLGAGMHMDWAKDVIQAFVADGMDFASDLDGMTFDTSLDDARASQRWAMKIGGTSSVLARLALAHADRSGPPPATFWSLPGDADVAFYSQGFDEDTLGRARQIVIDALAGALVDMGAKAADAKALANAVGHVLSGAPMAYASGLDTAAVRVALAAEAAKPPEGPAHLEAARATGQALLGWRVAVIDEKSAALTARLKELSALVGRASIVAALRAHDKAYQPPALTSAPLPRGAALPAGSTHWVTQLPPASERGRDVEHSGDKSAAAKKPEPAPKALVMHTLIVPDGDRTWLAIGGDELALASRIAAAVAHKADKQDKQALDGRADLASLKTASVGGAGFFTGRGMLELFITPGMTTPRRRLGEDLAELDRLVNKGASPIVFTSSAAAGTATAELIVPRGAIEDLVGAILRHGGF